MKRVILSVLGTVAGLVALLSFKTHGQPLPNAAGLPSAALQPGTGGTTTRQPAAQPQSSASSSAKSAAQAATRDSTGSAIQTRYGIVQVKITVKGSQITDASFVQLTAFDGRSQQINSYAGPILLRETLSTQSAHIDSVSGATYTSDGYVQSLQSAIDQAGIK